MNEMLKVALGCQRRLSDNLKDLVADLSEPHGDLVLVIPIRPSGHVPAADFFRKWASHVFLGDCTRS